MSRTMLAHKWGAVPPPRRELPWSPVETRAWPCFIAQFESGVYCGPAIAVQASSECNADGEHLRGRRVCVQLRMARRTDAVAPKDRDSLFHTHRSSCLKIPRPVGVAVSIASVSDRNFTPRPRNPPSIAIRPRNPRPSRSSFHTLSKARPHNGTWLGGTFVVSWSSGRPSRSCAGFYAKPGVSPRSKIFMQRSRAGRLVVAPDGSSVTRTAKRGSASPNFIGCGFRPETYRF